MLYDGGLSTGFFIPASTGVIEFSFPPTVTERPWWFTSVSSPLSVSLMSEEKRDAVLIGSMKTISHLVSVDQNLHKRNEEIKHEPIVHHLDAACLWQTRAHSNKHGCQDQHDLIQRKIKEGTRVILILNCTVKFTVTTASKKNGLK